MAKTRKSRKKQRQLEEMSILTEASSFLMTEDYASLRTNIAFSLPGTGGKSIAVTSSVQGEGKSTTALNLAISYAQLGKKVLLLECDLRLPTVSVRLRLEEGKGQNGLSQLLIGECTEEEAVRHMEKEQIDVVTAGAVPADPGRLLASEQMKKLVEHFKEEYDYVIMDCPPVNVVVDACLLAPCADGYLLAVRHEKAEYRAVSRLVSQLKRVEGNILGFVYTDAPSEDKRYGGYGYGYGYGKK